jgi:hypothetical protein
LGDGVTGERPKRYRYILRVEVGEDLRPRMEELLLTVARRLPGVQLSRNEYDDHGDHLMKTGRRQLAP